MLEGTGEEEGRKWGGIQKDRKGQFFKTYCLMILRFYSEKNRTVCSFLIFRNNLEAKSFKTKKFEQFLKRIVAKLKF